MKKIVITIYILFLAIIIAPFALAGHSEVENTYSTTASNSSNTTNHQSFQFPSDLASSTVNSIYIGVYDASKTFDACVSETLDSDNNNDDCIAGTYFDDVTTPSATGYSMVKLDDVDWTGYEVNTTYYLKIFDRAVGLRHAIDTGNPYPDGQWYYNGTAYTGTDGMFMLDIHPYEAPATSTPEDCETATSTTYSLPCDFQFSNDLSVITGCTEEYGDASSTLPTSTNYHYYQIPFLVFIVLLVIFLPLIYRFIIEVVIRLRK